MIDKNGLDWPKAEFHWETMMGKGPIVSGEYDIPDAWRYTGSGPAGIDGIRWNDDSENKRVVRLGVTSKRLTGKLDLGGLNMLQYFDCRTNQLTART